MSARNGRAEHGERIARYRLHLIADNRGARQVREGACGGFIG